MATSKGKDQNRHLRTAGVVQACHNFLISQTGFQQPGFWIPLAGFRIPQTKITWIPDSGLPHMGRTICSYANCVVLITVCSYANSVVLANSLVLKF